LQHLIAGLGKEWRRGAHCCLTTLALLLVAIEVGCSDSTPIDDLAMTPGVSTSLAATEIPRSPTPAPTATEPSLDQHRSTTAAQSFPMAHERAQAWSPDALWYGVVPYTSIERAFALPLDDARPSWHYRFASPDGSREYIVEVLGNEVLGSTETRLPDYIEPPIAKLDPLPTSWEGLIDSSAAVEHYHALEDSLLKRSPSMFLDYRLSQPKGSPFPIWELYNARSRSKPMVVLSARDGEVVSLAEIP